MRLVDVSVTVSELLPASWPGSMPFAHKLWNWFASRDQPSGSRYRCSGPYATHFMVIDEHTGTHLDGPTHFIPPEGTGLPHAGKLGELSGEKLSLARMCGAATVIDVAHLNGTVGDGVSPEITTGHIEEWEAGNGEIATPVVLFRTGWDRHFVEGRDGELYVHRPLVTKDSPGWPAPAAEVMAALSDRRVQLVGTDGASMGAVHDGAPVHWAGLSRGMLFVEELCNLGQLPVRGAFFQFLPLKVAGSTGGPGRAVAFVPVDST
jgi:kynurenine formamidase